jgi:hypothetical protein
MRSTIGSSMFDLMNPFPQTHQMMVANIQFIISALVSRTLNRAPSQQSVFLTHDPEREIRSTVETCLPKIQ